MTGERIRRRGLVQAAVGLLLATWVVVVAARAEVENPLVLVATAVTGMLVCLCAVAGGVVATRLADTAAAARLRHVFVVLDCVAMATFFPFYWFVYALESPGRPGDFAVGLLFVLVVPVVCALSLAVVGSQAVHKIVVDEYGPLMPDTGAPAQQFRVLGTVLVVAGVVLSIGVVVIAFTAPSRLLMLELIGLAVTLTPVLLGMRLGRVTDVHSARRRNLGMYFVLPAASGFAVAKFASLCGAVGMLFGALVFGAVVLLVIALAVVREYTGDQDWLWRGRNRPVSR
ncbi:hypothetical protein C8D88_11639 [Lentzea atacamensis]|uniref:Uncharacterized protein n=1 Tax=Lentzea atacamensis TaxID=531938 RepID=A0A316I2J1_9PSEU|nr:hypothetical protein [Lentzea atacamensis]PWK81629.1 hypothetical protein C8D88_11639 [Lentzea atacamensis]